MFSADVCLVPVWAPPHSRRCGRVHYTLSAAEASYDDEHFLSVYLLCVMNSLNML